MYSASQDRIAGDDPLKQLVDLTRTLVVSTQDNGEKLNAILARNETEQFGPLNFAHDHPYAAVGSSSRHIRPALSTPGAAAINRGPDVQQEFRTIKDSLQSVRLLEDHKVHDGKAGIRRQDQQAVTTISKCARYQETALKILQGIDVDSISLSQLKDNLQQLYTVVVANVNFLQDEYSALVVKGSTDEKVARMFRSFRSNTSGLTPEAINDLRLAAEITAATSSTPDSNHRGGYAPRGRGRPWRGRGYHRRGGYQRDDAYSAYQGAGSTIPTTSSQDNN